MLYDNGGITDDNGKPMRPVYHNAKYWQQIGEPAMQGRAPPVIPLGNTQPATHGLSLWQDDLANVREEINRMKPSDPNAWIKCPSAVKPAPEIPTKEETKMVKIKQATLINGSDSDEFGIDTLISMIEAEEDRIKYLDKVKTESVAIAALKEKHTANIAALVKILDNKEAE